MSLESLQAFGHLWPPYGALLAKLEGGGREALFDRRRVMLLANTTQTSLLAIGDWLEHEPVVV